MKRGYLRTFGFSWYSKELLTKPMKRVPDERMSTYDLLHGFMQQNMYGFCTFWKQRLRAERIYSDTLAATDLTVRLTNSPDPEIAFEDGFRIRADVDFNPREIVNLSMDTVTLGEQCISWVEKALPKLATVEGLPIQLFSEWCDDYRNENYVAVVQVGQLKIPDTNLIGRVEVEFSCADTKRLLYISYQGKELLKVTLNVSEKAGDWLHSMKLAEFRRVGYQFTVFSCYESEYEILKETIGSGAVDPMACPKKIDLSTFPEVKAVMDAKGWVTKL